MASIASYTTAFSFARCALLAQRAPLSPTAPSAPSAPAGHHALLPLALRPHQRVCWRYVSPITSPCLCLCWANAVRTHSAVPTLCPPRTLRPPLALRPLPLVNQRYVFPCLPFLCFFPCSHRALLAHSATFSSPAAPSAHSAPAASTALDAATRGLVFFEILLFFQANPPPPNCVRQTKPHQPRHDGTMACAGRECSPCPTRPMEDQDAQHAGDARAMPQHSPLPLHCHRASVCSRCVVCVCATDTWFM